MNRVRIYGKLLNSWYSEDEKGRKILTQEEYAYKEYDVMTGELVNAGSEDFSRKRLSDIKKKWVWTWDGEKYNKGGKRWFECRGYIEFAARDIKNLKIYLANKYKDSKLIQLRGA